VILLFWNSLVHAAETKRSLLGGAAPSLGRSVTVADTIRMSRIADQGRAGTALFSADAKRFVLTLYRGNLAKNQVEYWLLLFGVDEGFRPSTPKRLVTLSSSSNRPAIRDVRWIDNHTIAFLGTNLEEAEQVYTVDCESLRVDQLTNHATNVTSYAVAGNGDIFFTAEGSIVSFSDETASRVGIVISNEWLPDLMSDKNRRRSSEQQRLFKQSKARHEEILLLDQGITSFSAGYPPPQLSPDGKYLVIKVKVTKDIPAQWKGYEDRWIKEEVDEGRADGALYEFELIDTQSGSARVLLNSPTGLAHSEIVWSPNSDFVVISGTYLPLSVPDSTERTLRCTNRFVVEINVSTGKATPIAIASDDLRLRRWDAATNTLLLQTGIDRNSADIQGEMLAYRKTEGGWTKVGSSETGLSPSKEVEVALKEDINTPPKLFIRNLTTGEQLLLLDPNPQFRELNFGRVERITFKATNGRVAQGTMYFPVSYQPSTKYPLVIQTHAMDLGRFVIDGPSTTAFAAQPLAASGIVVVQLKEDLNRTGTPNEISDEASTYEGVIDYLDSKGVVDRSRVGIIGFSRTGLPVQYVLTQSKYKIAAATLADTSDAGYFRYLALLNQNGIGKVDNETINGALPFGKGLSVWVKNSPGFNLDKVNTVVRLEANSPSSILFEWEWFVGLSRLGKPVELVYLPDADHVLVKPWDRMISQQGTVDWFRFWLKDEEDPDPAKAEQYKRWRELRKMQQR
jgi:dipeptidyl aminopeptidase/acylaminoacyl peptidase